MMDVGGALHRISIFDSHDSVNAVGVDHRAGQEAQGGDSCRGRRRTRIDCAKLEARFGVRNTAVRFRLDANVGSSDAVRQKCHHPVLISTRFFPSTTAKTTPTDDKHFSPLK